MKIELHPSFKKSYKSRVAHSKKLVGKFEERIELFLKDSKDPILRDHSLKGKKQEFRAFSITGDIRVVYKKLLLNMFCCWMLAHIIKYINSLCS